MDKLILITVLIITIIQMFVIQKQNRLIHKLYTDEKQAYLLKFALKRILDDYVNNQEFEKAHKLSKLIKELEYEILDNLP